MMETIKELYQQLPSGKKGVFIDEVAKSFKMNPLSIRNHWFANHWQIPMKKRKKVIQLLKEKIHDRQTD